MGAWQQKVSLLIPYNPTNNTEYALALSYNNFLQMGAPNCDSFCCRVYSSGMAIIGVADGCAIPITHSF